MIFIYDHNVSIWRSYNKYAIPNSALSGRVEVNGLAPFYSFTSLYAREKTDFSQQRMAWKCAEGVQSPRHLGL